jgi:hypothetical protein
LDPFAIVHPAGRETDAVLSLVVAVVSPVADDSASAGGARQLAPIASAAIASVRERF